MLNFSKIFHSTGIASAKVCVVRKRPRSAAAMIWKAGADVIEMEGPKSRAVEDRAPDVGVIILVASCIAVFSSAQHSNASKCRPSRAALFKNAW